MKLGRLLLAVAVFAVIVLGAFPADAAINGTVVVTVLDDTKEPLIGATVTLSDANKQFPEQAIVTNANGVATFGVVPAGSAYVVTVTMPGYSRWQKGAIKVVPSTGKPTTVQAGLAPEKVEEVVVRGKQKVVEMDTDTQTKTSFSAEEFQDLPVFGRDYQAVLPMAAGVQDTEEDGNPNVLGARDRDFKMAVDGVSNVDPLTGQFMSNINPDAIEEIEIVTSGADASYGGATGGYGRMITKSGGNKFAASFNLYLQDSLFDHVGAGRYDREPLSFHRRQPSLFFSGPIIRDKLWFSLSHELIRQSNPIYLRGGGESFVREFQQGRHADKLTWQVTPRNKLQLQWTSDPTDIEPEYVDDLHPRDTGAKLTLGGPTTTLKWTAPFSPTFMWESTVAFSDIEVEYYPYNRDAQNTCISGDAERNPWPFMAGYYCRDSSMGERFSGAFPEDFADKRQRWTYMIDAEKYLDEWIGGRHKIKFGAGLERSRYTRDLTIRPTLRLVNNDPRPDLSQGGLSNPYQYTAETTSYYFPGQVEASLNSMLRAQRGVDQSLGHYYFAYVTDTYEPRPNLSINVGLRFSREELSSDGYKEFDPLAERGNYDAAVQACGQTCESTCARFGSSACSSCIKRCAYRSSTAFTLHALDDPRLVSFDGGSPTCGYALNTELCNQLSFAMGYTGAESLAFRQTDRFTIVNNHLAPTFKISWDPRNDGKTKLSLTAGRYYGDTFLLPIVYENGPDYITQLYAFDSERLPTNADGSLPAPAPLGDSAFSVQVIDRNLRKQYNDEYTFQAEREIAPETSLKLTLISRQFNDQLQQYDINHRPITDDEMRNRDQRVIPGDPNNPGGDCALVRGLYWDCTGLLVSDEVAGGLNGPPTRYLPDGLPDLAVVNPFFNNIYVVGNYNSSTYRAAILELNRRWFQNWEMTASYTWSRARGKAEDFEGSLGGNDVTNTDITEGPLSYDQPHVFKVIGRVLLPYWGGFRLGGSAVYQSGLPYSIVEERGVSDFPTDLTAGEAARLRELYPNISLTSHTRMFESQRTVFVTGRRNDQRNPAWWTIDVNAQKEFMLKDVKTTLEFGIYNLLDDDTQNIAYVVRRLAAVVGGQRIYYDIPVGGWRFGRRYQLALKVSWG